METFLYFFWSGISLAVFYLVYILLLKQETFFMANRIYLLASVCLSVIMPLFDLSGLIALPKTELMSLALPGRLVDNSVAFTGGTGSLVSVLYWSGVAFSSAWLLFKIFHVKKQIRMAEQGGAFSFWHIKVVDRNLAGFKAIDAHENVHIKQFHSIDRLFIEVVGIFFWFNPIVYCYRNSLKCIHEYLADDYAASFAESKKKYAMMLFLQNFKAGPALANSFHGPSLLEARINMLQRGRSDRKRLWKYVLSIPMIALLTAMCAFSAPGFVGTVAQKGDKSANFPGGFEAFSQYLIRNARKASGKRGRVKVSFIVETDGLVTNAKVEKSLDELSDREALRLIKSSPLWEPAVQNGDKVRSAYQIGVNF